MQDNGDIDYTRLLQQLFAPEIVVEVIPGKDMVRIEISCPSKPDIPMRIYSELAPYDIHAFCKEVLQLHVKASFFTIQTVLSISDTINKSITSNNNG